MNSHRSQHAVALLPPAKGASLNIRSPTLLPELDLKREVARLTKDRPDLDLREIYKAELEYRRFLWLARTYPNTSLSPTKLADELWHRHILFTQKYQSDCQCVFGCFLHHEPFDGFTNKALVKESHENGVRLYRKHFRSRSEQETGSPIESSTIQNLFTDRLVFEDAGIAY